MTIRELQLKASLKQAAIESCPGHTWGNVYWSKINYMHGSSAVCRNCGERRSLDDIAKDPNADWVGAMPPLEPLPPNNAYANQKPPTP